MKILKLKGKEGKRQRFLQTRRLRIRFYTGLFAALAGTALAAGAQTFSIDWHKIAGGGGASAGGAYQLSGTIGQPDTSDALLGGNSLLTGGFWSLISVAQTPGAPTLWICSSGGTVTVYWQNVGGCTLQQSSSGGAPNSWMACPCSPIMSNGTNYVNFTAPIGSLFFRLCRH